MNDFPKCQACQQYFKLKGPPPYLLPCLHAVCETCVTSTDGGDISCSQCQREVNLTETHLQKDVVRQREIFHLTVQHRPSELLCTHEDDGNQAVCWCQECEEFLCEHCQNMHESFKATRRHAVQEIADFQPGSLDQEEYCSTHTTYPLDMWDRNCNILVCSRCRRGDHVGHDVEDNDLAVDASRMEIETQQKEVQRVDDRHVSLLEMIAEQLRSADETYVSLIDKISHTFHSLKALLDQREKEILITLQQNTDQTKSDLDSKITIAQSNHLTCMVTLDYIKKALLYSSKYDLLKIKKTIGEITHSCIASEAPEKREDIPLLTLHTDGLEKLKSILTSFGEIATLRDLSSQKLFSQEKATQERVDYLMKLEEMENEYKKRLKQLEDDMSTSQSKVEELQTVVKDVTRQKEEAERDAKEAHEERKKSIDDRKKMMEENAKQKETIKSLERSVEDNKVTVKTLWELAGRGGRPSGQAGGSMEERWNTFSSKAIRNIDRNIDVSKLRIEKNADENIQLGPARSFGGWGRGSSGGGSRASKEDSYTTGRGGRPSGQAGGSMEEGWNTVSSKAIRNIDRNIDVSKLRIEKNADENIQLGPARSFGGWGRGSSGGGSRASKEGEKSNAPGNRFSALSKEDDQRSRAFGRGVSPARGDGRLRANTPGGGFNRGNVNPRSSQELERERALASARSLSGRSTPPSGTTSREGRRNRGATREIERPAPPAKELSEEEMEKKTISIIDEYLHIQDRKEAIQCVQELNSSKTTHFFVYFAINHVLERSKQARQQTGHLLHDLINQKVISVDVYLEGLTEILQAAEDMEIDIPKIWQYLGELIGPMIQDGSVPLSFLNTACEPLKASGKAGNLMAEVLHDASQRLGHKIVGHLWRNNCMDWSFFVPQEKIQQFLKDENLEFTVGPDSAPSTPTSKVSTEWIKENLTQLQVNPKYDNEKIFDWIEANIPDEITKENRFIRALMTSVCSSAIVGSGNMARVDQEVIKKWRALLLKYLDHQPVFELQALYALQALNNSLEHPLGVLRTFFDTLFDEEIISEDAFNQWETSKEEPEGKGVALKQVVQFFAWLREGEEEEADS